MNKRDMKEWSRFMSRPKPEKKKDKTKNKYKDHSAADLLIELAAAEEQIASLKKELQEVRHGKRFTISTPYERRTGYSGLYFDGIGSTIAIDSNYLMPNSTPSDEVPF